MWKSLSAIIEVKPTSTSGRRDGPKGGRGFPVAWWILFELRLNNHIVDRGREREIHAQSVLGVSSSVPPVDILQPVTVVRARAQ